MHTCVIALIQHTQAFWVRGFLPPFESGIAFPCNDFFIRDAALSELGLVSAHGMNIHDNYVVTSMIPSLHRSFGFSSRHAYNSK